MIKVTLPDGAVREYEDGASPHDVAVSISNSLAKKALAAKVNGELYDLMRPLEGDVELALITAKDLKCWIASVSVTAALAEETNATFNTTIATIRRPN